MSKSFAGILLMFTSSAMAQTHSHANHGAEAALGWNFAPHASTAVTVGGSTGDSEFLEESGHHDPHYDGFNMQALEMGGRLSYGEDFALMAIYNLQWDRKEAWDGHWEEAYMDFRLHPNLVVRTGMQQPPFGRENDLHVHGRNFVQSALSTTRFLGEDGLILNGVSFAHTWGADEQHSLRWGGGSVFTPGHEHDEEEHDDYALHAEEGLPAGHAFFARWESNFGANTVGISAVYSENEWDRTTFIVGADIERSFRIAGKNASLAAEWSYRDVDAMREDPEEKTSFDETALSLTFAYEMAEHWQSNSRIEWLSGVEEAGLDERTRFSTNLSHVYCWADELHGTTRLQYDADFLPGGEIENSVWLQVVFEWGDGH